MKKKLLHSIILLLIIHYSFLTSYAQTNPFIQSGKVKQEAGNHSGAIFDFTTGIKQIEPKVQKYLKEKEEYENKINGLDETLKFKEDIPQTDTGYAALFFLRGSSYYAMGKNSEAMQDFNTAIKINPSFVSAYYLRGKLLWSLGKKENACVDFNKASSLGSKEGREMFDYSFCWKDAEIAYNNASSKVRLKEYQEALNLIQKSLKLCPDSAAYIAIRGLAYFGLEKTELAKRDFDRAVSLNPNIVNAYYGRGMTYFSLSQYQDAFDDLTKAIGLDSKLTDAYLYRAYSCEKMDKKKSALYDYEQVQRLNPANALSFFKSGLLRKEMGDVKGACVDFKKAAAIGYSEAQDYADGCK